MVETLGAALAFVAAVAIAAQVVFVRVGTVEGDPLDVLAVVLAVSTAVIVVVAGVAYYPRYRLTSVALLAFAGAGLTGTFLGMIAYYTGIARLGASRTEPLKASMPLFATLFAVVLLGERLTPGNLVGIVLVVAGVALISWESRSGALPRANGSTWALALPVVAALLFGLEPILAKVGFAQGTPPMVGLAVKTTVALGALVGYLRWRRSLAGLPARVASSLRWYVAASLAFTAFLVAFYAALDVAAVVVVIPLFQTSPLVVILLSAAFLGRLERLTARLLAGAVVVTAGAVMITVFG